MKTSGDCWKPTSSPAANGYDFQRYLAAKVTVDEQIHRQRLVQRNTAGRIHLMPKPVVAMLPGPAAGAGLSLALAAGTAALAAPSPGDPGTA